MYTGQVLCEGEGHLNARSCLLEGPVKSLRSKGRCVKMEIPDSLSCSLFPGQVCTLGGRERERERERERGGGGGGKKSER